MKKRRISKPSRAPRAKPRARADRSPRTRVSRPLVTLPAECTLAEAEGLKLRLLGFVKSVSPVTIDVSTVRRIDTATMQLVAAFVRDRAASALPTQLLSPSPSFADGARLLGLQTLFDSPAS